MNAPFQNARALAHSLMAGVTTLLPAVEYDLFQFSEWQDAAQAAIDSGDYSELVWMVAREQAYDEFCQWQHADYRNREFADFGNWLAEKARWNAPNKYGYAMNAAERRVA